MFSFLIVIVRHAASDAAQCLGLFGAQLLPRGQAPGQLGAVVRVGGDSCAEFVLAAGGGVVEIAGVAVGGFGGGNTPLQARVAGILVEFGAGRIDSGAGVVETCAEVRGAAWAGFGFTHRRLGR
ncbi:hypothetical protein FEZ60_04705 [Rhodococcus sp. MS16]|nr:hypothetical protein [Rhodococcus sp. MS16]